MHDRNHCVLYTGGQRFDPNTAYSHDRMNAEPGSQLFNFGRDFLSPDLGPQISSHEESGDEELDKTVMQRTLSRLIIGVFPALQF